MDEKTTENAVGAGRRPHDSPMPTDAVGSSSSAAHSLSDCSRATTGTAFRNHSGERVRLTRQLARELFSNPG